jgi:hypothetical protein
MGKKTDEKMEAVKVALRKWKSVAYNIDAGETRLKQAIAAREAANKTYQAYFAAKKWGRGNQAGVDKEMDADPEWKKIDKALDAAIAKVTYLENALAGLEGDLKTTRAGIRAPVLDLQKYVDEKDRKTSDPNKKKSVPLARALIKEVIAALS